MGRRGCPYAIQGSRAFRAVILHFDIVDATDNEEDVTAVRTFIFVFHFTITTAEGNGAEFF